MTPEPSVLEHIQGRTSEVASDRNFSTDDKAFGYWFLEDIEEFSPEEAEEYVVDGPWDNGRDAVYLDEPNKTLKIYQFKYSQSRRYLDGAFTDIQRALAAERTNLEASATLLLYIVTIATATDETFQKVRDVRRRIRTWLSRNGLKIQADVELYDLRKFAQIYERVYGVDVALPVKEQPIQLDDGFLALVDAGSLKDHIAMEELFAFNIRKSLGLRRGSVNAQIFETLENEDERDDFWMRNNGIVCLSTDPRWRKSAGVLDAKNFTIVNGAQTVSTIARFLEANPAVSDPVWVVAKILTVDEIDIDRARLLTKTSNTQTSTNDKDLRAVDASHRRLATWFDEYFDLEYVFRRGRRGTRGRRVIRMKDIAQAYIAFWEDEPNTSFSQAGKLFADSDYYDRVFPSDSIDLLRNRGSADERRAFLVDRILPVDFVLRIRSALQQKVSGEQWDKKWKSLSYHCLWFYRQAWEGAGRPPLANVRKALDSILDSTLDKVLDRLVNFCEDSGADIPRDLKSTALANAIREKGLLGRPWVREVQDSIGQAAVRRGSRKRTGSPKGRTKLRPSPAKRRVPRKS